MPRFTCRRPAERGFTLPELMAVIVIIAVLAALAVFSVRKYIRSSKTGEAVSMMTNIKGAEEAYKDETYTYLDVSGNFSSNWYPATAPGKFVTQWGKDTGAVSQKWATLGVQPGGPVVFTYAVVAVGPGVAYPTVPTTKTNAQFNLSGNAPDWEYVAVAEADLDGEGAPFTYVLSHSLTNDIYIENDGS